MACGRGRLADGTVEFREGAVRVHAYSRYAELGVAGALAAFQFHGNRVASLVLPGSPRYDALEHIGQPCQRIDLVQLRGLEQRRDDRPVLPAGVGTGEQSVLAPQGDGADRALDGVGIEFQTVS